MSEIKFRVWDKKNNKLYDGSNGAIGWSGSYIFQRNGILSLKSIEGNQDDNLIFMQFTGLKDKNGKDIYEGDMVRYETRENSFGIHQVIYEQLAAAFLLQAITRASVNPVGMKYLGDIVRSNKQYDTRTYELCEVIGNIYENPQPLNSNREKQK